MELIDTWNINRYMCKVLQKARIITLTFLLSNTVIDIKIHQSIILLLIFLIICPMYSYMYVLYYNIEKYGFSAVSSYLLLQLQGELGKEQEIKIESIVTKQDSRGKTLIQNKNRIRMIPSWNFKKTIVTVMSSSQRSVTRTVNQRLKSKSMKEPSPLTNAG